jgi:hypothetical protein
VAPGGDEDSVGGERLDATLRIGNVNCVSHLVDREGSGVGEGAVYVAGATPSRNVLPRGVELLHKGIVDV